MTIDIKVPGFPESVADGLVSEWRKQPGEAVKRDEVLVEIETDKVVFEVPAPAAGMLTDIMENAGATVVSGQLLGRIDEAVSQDEADAVQDTRAPVVQGKQPEDVEVLLAPAAERLLKQHALEASAIRGSGKDGRILKEDVLRFIEQGDAPPENEADTAPAAPVAGVTGNAERTAGIAPESGAAVGTRAEKRVPMTRLRARVAERLLAAQHDAAILTTFNEVNMQAVMNLRARYKEQIETQHGVRLGFMSFFVKAALEALRKFPEVNASIDGGDIVYHGFFDIGIAVGSPRGLVVPILRDADQLSMIEIEARIAEYAACANDASLAIEDITGGTFTITNGGVFGSLLSTPILNPPQSAILGMHKVEQRAVVENGEIVARPMMYLALSYDHRIIDGRDAVQFLVTIKDCIEDPARMLLAV